MWSSAKKILTLVYFTFILSIIYMLYTYIHCKKMLILQYYTVHIYTFFFFCSVYKITDTSVVKSRKSVDVVLRVPIVINSHRSNIFRSNSLCVLLYHYFSFICLHWMTFASYFKHIIIPIITSRQNNFLH